MKTFILIFVSLFSFAVFAQEQSKSKMEVIEDGLTDLSLSHSRYFNLPPEGKTQATVTYQSNNREGEKQSYQLDPYDLIYERVDSNFYGFKLSRGLADFAAASITFGYETTKYNIISDRVTPASASGMKDIGVNFTMLQDIDNGHMLYGMDLTLSPGDKILPSATAQGNSFSGGHTITPFIGIEKVSGQSVIGGRLSITTFAGEYQHTRETYYGDQAGVTPTDLNFFFEYPMSAKMDFGFQAGLGKHSNVPKPLADFYRIGFYGTYEADNFTSMDLNLAMKNKESGGEAQTYTEFTFALRRTL